MMTSIVTFRAANIYFTEELVSEQKLLPVGLNPELLGSVWVQLAITKCSCLKTD